MAKIVINNKYGGFTLSEEAHRKLEEIKGRELRDYHLEWELAWRLDKDLINIVEKMGEKANGIASDLKIEEYDSNLYYPSISNFDGKETLHLILREDAVRELIRRGNVNTLISLLKDTGAISNNLDYHIKLY